MCVCARGGIVCKEIKVLKLNLVVPPCLQSTLHTRAVSTVVYRYLLGLGTFGNVTDLVYTIEKSYFRKYDVLFLSHLVGPHGKFWSVWAAPGLSGPLRLNPSIDSDGSGYVPTMHLTIVLLVF